MYSNINEPSVGKNVLLAISVLLAFIAVAIVTLAFILSSQLGGMLQISYENYLLFFKFRYLLIFGAFLMVGFYAYINHKYRFFHNFTTVALIFTVIGFASLARLYLPIISFSTFQHKARYFPIEEAEQYIDRDDRNMIVIERNGVARAYSNRLSFLPHIAGGNFNGEDIIMAYCVLSSLPIAFKDDLGGNKMDLSVLLAPANNLLMYEHNSGEFIRQLKVKSEGTETPLQLVAVQKMPWRSFKQLYPDGEVFLPVNKSFMQKIMDKAIGGTVDSIIDDEKLFYKPMYILDPRLPETEKVWGVLVNNEPVAVSLRYLEKNNIVQMNLGGREIVIVYFKEYETVGAFYNDKGLTFGKGEIDPYGKVGDTNLERVEGLFNTVFWGVWAYFYPHTQLLK
ncbi:MAG: DUF3179 domain-containing protein [Desulfobulbaceae bacterium]|nr:DUF3179 domain-containing protein [Desulfobulbaceae bacterium]